MVLAGRWKSSDTLAGHRHGTRRIALPEQEFGQLPIRLLQLGIQFDGFSQRGDRLVGLALIRKDGADSQMALRKPLVPGNGGAPTCQRRSILADLQISHGQLGVRLGLVRQRLDQSLPHGQSLFTKLFRRAGQRGG